MIIDAVIPWVDGNDPVLTAKRQSYMSGDMATRKDVAASTRYANIGEIFWCVAAINRFAPFIRRIFIVTDGQDPRMDEWLEVQFPEGHIPVEIVDHRTIFEGYEEYLPTFNSLSIETMIWRIPGLSEHFICFNDDFIITSPVTEKDFFVDDETPVCVASWHFTPLDRLLRAMKPKKHGHKKVSFTGLMLAAGKRAGWHSLRFPRVNHTPRGLLKSWFSEWYSAHPEHLSENIKYRFRSILQYYPISLHYMDLLKKGKCEVRKVSDYLFYIEPKHGREYIVSKMTKMQRKEYKFLCVNNLDQASLEDRPIVTDWIKARLNLK